MVRFFIDRPIFASVLSIVVMLAGWFAINLLPVSQYPTIAPPTISIRATYPGANASTVEDTVTKIIEQNMIGLDGYMYMSSTSDSYGQSQISITFEPGTNPDIAQVQVQNKLQQCQSQLPETVQKSGIDVKKSTSSFLMIIGLISSDKNVESVDLADYAINSVKEPISRVEGVGDITVFGSSYSMRIWIDPDKLNKVNLTVPEVISAIKEQNAQVTYGSLGGAPTTQDQIYTYTIAGQSRLNKTEQFENIVVRVLEDGSKVLLKDVARIVLGNENYNTDGKYNGQSAVGIAVKLATGANALGTSEKVKSEIDRLSKYFPKNVSYVFPFDTTAFIKVSINEVVHTLFEAILLVFVVMYIFLQNCRATLIPTIAVPVVLLGTFGIMYALDFSINTLTMFGLVLAIGLLVDDAIVVVENVERIMSEDKVSPKEATIRSMQQITGALIGIALVLSAVFIPMAFFGGAAGVIYRQFSITIVSAMILSVFVALTLTPALCAVILKDENLEKQNYSGFIGVVLKLVDLIDLFLHFILKAFLRMFNNFFVYISEMYQKFVKYVVNTAVLYVFIYVAICLATTFMFIRIPSSFLPEEDQGVLMVMVQLPSGSTLEKTKLTLNKMRNYFETNEKDTVESIMTVAGFSFSGSGQNAGMAFVKLKDWSLRKDSSKHVKNIVARAFPALMSIREGLVIPFNLPAIPELGTAAGFDLFVQDTQGLGHEELMKARTDIVNNSSQGENGQILTKVRANGMDDTPTLNVSLDYEKAISQGLTISNINTTLSTAWGSLYVDDFIHKNRVKKVYIQADANSRMSEKDFNKWYVKNSSGKLVPFSSFGSLNWSYGSPRLERFNGIPAVQINGEAKPGVSTGQAMDKIEEIVNTMEGGYSVAWNGVSFQEKQAGAQEGMLYLSALVFVFLCLAALYESWSIPFAVILVVPLGIFGSVGAAYLSQVMPFLFPWANPLENDIYFRVGFITTVGLSAKNAILIVEFAKELYDKGVGLTDSVVQAARIRLRPILMTSFAFILGVMPLALSSGAGAAGRNEIGICVIGGMLSATVLAIFFVPVFFVLVMRYCTAYKPKALKLKEVEKAMK
ncbi:MAG: efflux RND transporter permease subunit [Succinivibrionaceae bacterium]